MTLRETIAEGPTVEEALDAALEELGVQQDAVEYEVLEEGGRKIFGLGSEKAAKVKVTIRPDYIAELDRFKEAVDEVLENHEVTEAERTPVRSGDRSAPPAEIPELSEEELDRVADEAVSAIQSVLQGFGIAASIEEYEGDDGEIILDVVGDDLGVLIGRHGRTLDSIQTLVSAITNRRLGFRYPVLVDIEGYRNRRREKLIEIARRSAERAARQGSPVDLRPMSSFERKVVHMYLRDNARVTTSSSGEEPFRHVVISPRTK